MALEGLKVSFTVWGLTQRIMFSTVPALSLVPERSPATEKRSLPLLLPPTIPICSPDALQVLPLHQSNSLPSLEISESGPERAKRSKRDRAGGGYGRMNTILFWHFPMKVQCQR